MCRVLEVTASGFYTWRRRPPSARSVQDAALTLQISSIIQEHHGRYGAPRIRATLQRAGIVCSEKRVSRLMRAQGLGQDPPSVHKDHRARPRAAGGRQPAGAQFQTNTAQSGVVIGSDVHPNERRLAVLGSDAGPVCPVCRGLGDGGHHAR